MPGPKDATRMCWTERVPRWLPLVCLIVVGLARPLLHPPRQLGRLEVRRCPLVSSSRQEFW
eukprot:3284100-Lingulodinium_polyedra.AAC.1